RVARPKNRRAGVVDQDGLGTSQSRRPKLIQGDGRRRVHAAHRDEAYCGQQSGERNPSPDLRPARFAVFDLGELGWLPLEDCPVGPGGDLDVYGAFWTALVVLRQPFANLRRPYADDRIGAGVIIDTAAEHLGSDHALLEQIVLSGKRVLDHPGQECLALVCGPKGRTLKDTLKTFPDLDGFSARPGARNLTRRSTHRGTLLPP